MIKELLQGRSFKHPLHPALVHFPIGLFILSLILDLMTLLATVSPVLVRAAFYTMAFALGMAVAAVITSFSDWRDIRLDLLNKKSITYYRLLNLIAVGLLTVSFALRFNQLDRSATAFIPLFLSFAGIGLLTISSYFSGRLIYTTGRELDRQRSRD